jgi:hypothetical protein
LVENNSQSSIYAPQYGTELITMLLSTNLLSLRDVFILYQKLAFPASAVWHIRLVEKQYTIIFRPVGNILTIRNPLNLEAIQGAFL